MREKQASFGREKAANWPVWKPLFGKNGLASPKGDLQICSEVGNSRGRVLVPDCPLPALQRHSQILELFSMKVKAMGTPGVGDGQGGLACCDSWGRKESDTTEQLI